MKLINFEFTFFSSIDCVLLIELFNYYLRFWLGVNAISLCSFLFTDGAKNIALLARVRNMIVNKGSLKLFRAALDDGTIRAALYNVFHCNAIASNIRYACPLIGSALLNFIFIISIFFPGSHRQTTDTLSQKK